MQMPTRSQHCSDMISSCRRLPSTTSSQVSQRGISTSNPRTSMTRTRTIGTPGALCSSVIQLVNCVATGKVQVLFASCYMAVCSPLSLPIPLSPPPPSFLSPSLLSSPSLHHFSSPFHPPLSPPFSLRLLLPPVRNTVLRHGVTVFSTGEGASSRGPTVATRVSKSATTNPSARCLTPL